MIEELSPIILLSRNTNIKLGTAKHTFVALNIEHNLTLPEPAFFLSDSWTGVEWESPRQSDRRGELIPNLTALLSRTTVITVIFIRDFPLLTSHFRIDRGQKRINQSTRFWSQCSYVLMEWESPRQSDRRGELIPNLTALLSRTPSLMLIFQNFASWFQIGQYFVIIASMCWWNGKVLVKVIEEASWSPTSRLCFQGPQTSRWSS